MAEETKQAEQPQQEQGFNLNTWKGVYQNNKAKPAVAFEWLWKNFDAENWTFWRITYKHNSEITQGFFASNGIKGTVQRWENARKVGMGIFSVLKGGEHPWMQTGCLLLKGKEVPAEVAVEGNDDYVLYDFKKLDPVTNAEDKAIVESYLSFGDDVLHDGKNKLEHADGLKFL
jgi:elongation factor 1-gamma